MYTNSSRTLRLQLTMLVPMESSRLLTTDTCWTSIVSPNGLESINQCHAVCKDDISKHWSHGHVNHSTNETWELTNHSQLRSVTRTMGNRVRLWNGLQIASSDPWQAKHSGLPIQTLRGCAHELSRRRNIYVQEALRRVTKRDHTTTN